MRNRLQDIFRRALQQVGNPHQKLALAQPNGVVDIREAEELDPQFRDLRPRPQLAVRLFEQLADFCRHLSCRLARADHSGCCESSLWSCFFLCLNASSCSANKSRWSFEAESTVSSALPNRNS